MTASTGGTGNSPFTGLSAFPLTPLRDDAVDEYAFASIVSRLAASGVDSITALGSTGCAAYLTSAERERVGRLALEHAGSVPVIVGVSALRTSQLLAHADAAAEAGAAGVLLAPMSYQPLTDREVLELYRTVTEHTDLPVVVYDNPATTHFTFSLELYARIAQLPGIASLKIPPIAPENLRERVAEVRAALPEHVTLGISGDACAAAALLAGCDGWHSVIAGTCPQPALEIMRAAAGPHPQDALTASERLEPLWELFADHGSLRVVAAIAEHLGLAPGDCLPQPLLGLSPEQRERTAEAVAELGLR
ncbi:UNVERIFIED_CONTAM: dihydrodipicolinate synthase family protein [Kocuria sp. CPCC 205295]|uniref:dihydrodipicolinate synthase family protein n=1 Tax=Kocuria TaxID=57493 RepID=UPI0035DFE2B8